MAAELERAKYAAATERYHDRMEVLEGALEEEGSRAESLEKTDQDLARRVSQLSEEKELISLKLEDTREKLADSERRAREAELQVMELETTNRALEAATAAAAGLEDRVLTGTDVAEALASRPAETAVLPAACRKLRGCGLTSPSSSVRRQITTACADTEAWAP